MPEQKEEQPLSQEDHQVADSIVADLEARGQALEYRARTSGQQQVVPSSITDPQLRRWATTFVAEKNEEYGLGWNRKQVAEKGMILARLMRKSYNNGRRAGLDERQSWNRAYADMTDASARYTDSIAQARSSTGPESKDGPRLRSLVYRPGGDDPQYQETSGALVGGSVSTLALLHPENEERRRDVEDKARRNIDAGVRQAANYVVDHPDDVETFLNGVAMLPGLIGKSAAAARTIFGLGRQLLKRPASEQKPLRFDYSTPEAPFSLRIDPHTGKGPMHIDARSLPSTGDVTKLGATRNAPEFWQAWNKKYPGTLSEENLARINQKAPKVPRVDEHWLQHFPEHQNYLGQKLEHHHLDYGNLVVPLPKTLHRGTGATQIWHTQ